jgi:hypothetical protein
MMLGERFIGEDWSLGNFIFFFWAGVATEAAPARCDCIKILYEYNFTTRIEDLGFRSQEQGIVCRAVAEQRRMVQHRIQHVLHGRRHGGSFGSIEVGNAGGILPYITLYRNCEEHDLDTT